MQTSFVKFPRRHCHNAGTYPLPIVAAPVAYLIASGAKHVLTSNLPDLDATPEAVFLGLAAASSDATAKFNSLVGSLLGLENLFAGLDIDCSTWRVWLPMCALAMTGAPACGTGQLSNQ